MFPVILLEHWRDALLALLSVALFSLWSIDSRRIESRDGTITTLSANAKIDEIQKDALRKAITDQSDAVEAQRINAEERASIFEQASKDIRSKYEAIKNQVYNLSGDVECEAMRDMVKEAVQ